MTKYCRVAIINWHQICHFTSYLVCTKLWEGGFTIWIYQNLQDYSTESPALLTLWDPGGDDLYSTGWGRGKDKRARENNRHTETGNRCWHIHTSLHWLTDDRHEAVDRGRDGGTSVKPSLWLAQTRQGHWIHAVWWGRVHYTSSPLANSRRERADWGEKGGGGCLLAYIHVHTSPYQ